MHFLDRVIAQFSPGRALQRVKARKALAHYDAATTGRRSGSWIASAADADAAAGRRRRIAQISRDMIRNTPYAGRAQSVIANNVVGKGIIPKIEGGSDRLRKRGLSLIKAHLDTTAIDAEGRTNLYGLQKLVQAALVDAGEVLVRRRLRQRTEGLPVPLQLQVLEADFIDDAWDGSLSNGNVILEGIEYDSRGRRVAYYLFDQHPGGRTFRPFGGLRTGSRRVPAEDVLHIYRQDRPGQRRGVSWFANVALHLQDLGDHQDALIMQQKIAACFAAFRMNPDSDDDADATENPLSQLEPGAIYDLGPNEEVTFAEPKGIGGGKEVDGIILRAIASGLGITYEALSGDLSGVNFSSGRMGRIEMDGNIAAWQNHILLPQFLQPLAVWFQEAWFLQDGNPQIMALGMTWTMPRRVIVDPGKETQAEADAVKAGFKSRQSVIRERGEDPEDVDAEILLDQEFADENGLVFSTSPKAPAPAAPPGGGGGAGPGRDPDDDGSGNAGGVIDE